MASRILGMGDVLTLIEKAEAAFDQKKAEELEQKLRSNKFTLADYYDQLVQLKGMGSVQDLLGMMPGMGNLKNVQVDEGALGRTEAIIQSMTPYERENPNCLNHSRKRRIAAGSGVKVEEVNKLLKSFEMMQTLMRQMNGSGKRKKKNRGFGGLPNLPAWAAWACPNFNPFTPWPDRPCTIKKTRSFLEVFTNGQDQTEKNGREEGSLLPYRCRRFPQPP